LSKGLFALFAVFALALLAAGCGSSGGSTSTASITKAEFIKQADAICAKGNKQIQTEIQAYSKKVGLSGNTQPTNAQVTEIANTILVPSVQSQHDDIGALGAPSGQESQVNAILAAVQDGIDQAKKDPTTLLKSNDTTFAKANQLAKDYGLTVCGSNG
jgi:hypothetical protein